MAIDGPERTCLTEARVREIVAEMIQPTSHDPTLETALLNPEPGDLAQVKVGHIEHPWLVILGQKNSNGWESLSLLPDGKSDACWLEHDEITYLRVIMTHDEICKRLQITTLDPRKH